MASKRQSQEQEGDDDRGVQTLAQNSKRRRWDSPPAEPRTVIENLRSIQLMSTDIVANVSDLVQRLIKEELERRLVPRPTINQIGTSGARYLKLNFENELPATIFTDSEIKAKDGTPVKIALYDIRSQSIVTDDRMSSKKIDICVFNGEFGSDGVEDWTAEEFKAKILPPRKNKGKLLQGETVITLKNGVGYINKIRFTDNSCWIRCRQFRLGAKVVESTSNEANIITEGTSKPFVVKDRRGEVNRKHYPPSPNDEIWRLSMISRDGKIHQRLSSHGINTVKDLLHLHETNPSSLQEIFGKIQAKRKTIIEHAKTCVVEVAFDGQNDRSLNTLHPDDEKWIAEKVKPHAHRNVEDLIPVDETRVQALLSPFSNLQSARQADQLEERQDFSQPSTSTLHIGEAAHSKHVGFSELLSGMSMEGNALSQVPTVVPGVYSPDNDYSYIQFSNDFSFPTFGREQGDK